jgi:L-2-hydroxyglutarate oxidase LhgO
VHAGLYYAKNSLKAKLCVRGKHLLYDFARTRGVPFRRCGKIVVATSADQVATLDAIKHRALDNRVDDVELLDAEDVRRLEPEVQCLKALLSPSTGDRRNGLEMSALATRCNCSSVPQLHVVVEIADEQVSWTRMHSWAR